MTDHERGIEAATKAWMDDRGIDDGLAHWRESIEIASSAYLSALAPQAGDNAEEPATFETCERCQGNGEIVTDWERYLHSHEGDKGDEAVTECPDCDGEGKLKHSTLATDEMVTAGCIAAYGEGFLNWPENSIRDGKMMVSRVLRAALASHPCTSTPVVSQNAKTREGMRNEGQ